MGLLTTALLVGGGVALAPAAAVAGLGLIGFSGAGPVAGTVVSSVTPFALPNTQLSNLMAGSLAAGIQASVYGGAVGSGSLFAMAQSAAMGGIAVSTTQTVGGALGVVAALF